MGYHKLKHFRPMDKVKAEDVIRTLSIDLKVSAPRLDWSPRHKNGKYGFGTIEVGPKTWRGLDCLIHEFAHHLDRRAPTFEERQYGRGRRHHGEPFYQALLRVTEAAERLYGHEYDWLTEYRSLRKRRLTDRVAYAKAAGSSQQAPK